jgi:tryptophan synthase beta chain
MGPGISCFAHHHSHSNVGSYESYLADKLHNYKYPEELIKQALKELPKIPA